MVGFLVIGIMIVIFILTGILARNSEARRFNEGKCVRCGHDLRYFDTDSQGGNGYICDECDYGCWVSYHSIDRHYHDRG